VVVGHGTGRRPGDPEEAEENHSPANRPPNKAAPDVGKAFVRPRLAPNVAESGTTLPGTRAVIGIVATVEAGLGLLFIFQILFVLGLVPLPGRTPLSSMLIGSCLDAAAAVSVDAREVGRTPILDPVEVRLGFRRVKVDAGEIQDVTGAPSPEVKLTGGGKAYLFRNGRVVVGSWSRSSLEESTAFEAKDGSEFELEPGLPAAARPGQGDKPMV